MMRLPLIAGLGALGQSRSADDSPIRCVEGIFASVALVSAKAMALNATAES